MGQADAISAYLTDEPFELQQAHFDYTTLTPLSDGIDFYGDTLFTTETEIKKHPERVASSVKASVRGWRYALSHQEEMIALIPARHDTRHGIEHLRHEAGMTLRMVMPNIVEIGYMNSRNPIFVFRSRTQPDKKEGCSPTDIILFPAIIR